MLSLQAKKIVEIKSVWVVSF